MEICKEFIAYETFLKDQKWKDCYRLYQRNKPFCELLLSEDSINHPSTLEKEQLKDHLTKLLHCISRVYDKRSFQGIAVCLIKQDTATDFTRISRTTWDLLKSVKLAESNDKNYEIIRSEDLEVRPTAIFLLPFLSSLSSFFISILFV
jgi:hypothetical protein